MAITTPQGVDLQAPEPLELKTVKATLTDRDNISLVTRYDGLKVYVLQEKLNYQLQGGITNDKWVPLTVVDYSILYTRTQLQTAGEAQVHWSNLTNVPLTFDPSAHTHVEADITDLQPYLLNINGQSIGDLSDVTITSPQPNDFLKFVGGVWVNAQNSLEWGNITGDIINQLDLQTALDGKKDEFTELAIGREVVFYV